MADFTEQQVAEIEAKLTKAQRERLVVWPNGESSLFRNGPDAIARELCDLGIGVMMPWKHGRQMGLTARVGVPLHIHLRAEQ